MAIYQLEEHVPQVPDSAYVAEEAVLIGKVKLGEGANVWPGATLRGDNDPISIGNGTSVQEGVVMHTDIGRPVVVGDDVVVGHQAMLHSCTVGDGALIGMQAIVLNRAEIGKECLVAAGALVTEGKSFPARSLIVGSPAKVVRTLRDEEVAHMRDGARRYVARGQMYKKRLKRIG